MAASALQFECVSHACVQWAARRSACPSLFEYDGQTDRPTDRHPHKTQHAASPHMAYTAGDTHGKSKKQTVRGGKLRAMTPSPDPVRCWRTGVRRAKEADSAETHEWTARAGSMCACKVCIQSQ
mmetsp:Transcript_20455/g.49750  ORF Transcript_20455/g.49750 Transcript_20455/m.49750 type:complete len:124 (-) Transcript_20455:1003-1374(-)